jgi:hypothetical protein
VTEILDISERSLCNGGLEIGWSDR